MKTHRVAVTGQGGSDRGDATGSWERPGAEAHAGPLAGTGPPTPGFDFWPQSRGAATVLRARAEQKLPARHIDSSPIPATDQLGPRQAPHLSTPQFPHGATRMVSGTWGDIVSQFIVKESGALGEQQLA